MCMCMCTFVCTCMYVYVRGEYVCLLCTHVNALTMRMYSVCVCMYAYDTIVLVND